MRNPRRVGFLIPVMCYPSLPAFPELHHTVYILHSWNDAPWGCAMPAAPLGVRGHPKTDGEAGGLKKGMRYSGRCSCGTCHTSSPPGCWSGAEGFLCLLKGRAEERRPPHPHPPPQATWTAGLGPCQ